MKKSDETFVEIASFGRQPYQIVDFGVHAPDRFGVWQTEKEKILMRDNDYNVCLAYVTRHVNVTKPNSVPSHILNYTPATKPKTKTTSTSKSDTTPILKTVTKLKQAHKSDTSNKNTSSSKLDEVNTKTTSTPTPTKPPIAPKLHRKVREFSLDDDEDTPIIQSEPTIKRGRGRPKGSKNKPK